VRGVLAELVAGAADVTEAHRRLRPRAGDPAGSPHKAHPIFDEIVRSPAVISILTKLIGLGQRLHGLQAEHEVSAIWLAGRVASGLGILSTQQ
jgi:phytanoyl-CoA hydroxylase